ncbi:MAG: ABC transporter substrate-binding protein [Candidatus Entotheonellia bacterium]
MNRMCRHLGRSVVLMLLALTVAWGILATTVVAAELVPPRPLPSKPAGGTLNIAYFREVSSPDGFQATGSFDRMYFYAGNEVLAGIGKDSLYDPAESLAYAYEVLDDGKRYRFHLRQGVQFQGGYGEMTAADVAWSLNRIHRKDTGSRWSNRFRSMDRAEEVDRYTADVYLKTLDANLIVRMFDRESIVHSRKRWEEVGGPEQHKLHPIGTGPYQLVDWKVGVGTEWVKHPQYWRGEPMADRVNIRVITENRARLAALQTGEVQVAWLQAEQVVEAQKDPNIKVWSFTGVGWDGWSWSTGLPPLDDLRMRRALVKAVDRDALNKAVYLNTLRPSQAHTFPPESPYGINAQELWQGEWLKYDPAAAKKLVHEVAKERGLKLPIELKGVCERRPDRQLVCEFLQAAWDEIDVKLNFAVVSNAAERLAVMEQCQTHFNQTGGLMHVPHLMEPILQSTGENNYSANLCKDKGHQLSPADAQVQADIDRLLDQATQQPTLNQAIDIYKQVQMVALKNAWQYVPAMLRVNYIGCHIPSTGGCEDNPMRGDGFIRPGDFWVKK